MDLINQFIENYKKKLTFMKILDASLLPQLEDALQSAGIRAMVTYRSKSGTFKKQGAAQKCQTEHSL